VERVFLASLERSRVQSSRSIVSKAIPLVDRTEEMNALKEAVDRTVQDEGGLVLIHGEAGIGKTRLLREVGTYAQSCGMQVLHGRCPALFRMDGIPPYILWKEIIKDYLDTCTEEQLNRVVSYYPAEVAKLVPEIGQKLRTIPQSFPIRPEQEQNRLFEAVSQFIINISRDAPLLVILDDLQLTDYSSLLLLHYLAYGVYRAPLLLLGAYRSTDVAAEHPLTPTLTELNRELLLQSVSLKRMSVNDISEMIKQILEQDDIPSSFCDLVYEKTRGNPFFTEEVIKSLKEEDIIHRKESRWEIKDVSKIEFPESVKSVVKARIGRLGDECQKVLTMASLIGNEFTLDALQGVVGLDEDKLHRIMDELLKTGLLRHRVARGEDVCSFTDIIVRDVVYEEVGTFERKKLHRIVGTALEKAYAQKVDEHLGELALHFLVSGDKNKALDCFLKAGEKAQSVYANREAISYFQSALGLLQEESGALQERANVLETLGDIESVVGEYDACAKCWNDALLLRTQLNEKDKTARLHRKMANVFWSRMGKTEEAKHHHDKALKILEAEPESVELANLCEDICRRLWRTGQDLVTARSWAEKTLEIAKRLNAQEVVASTYNDLASISAFAGEGWRTSVEYLERALKIALDNGYVESALRAYINLGLLLPAEECKRILELRERGYELAKKVGVRLYQSWIGDALANTYIGMGDMVKALPLAEESVALDRKSREKAHLPVSLGLLGLIHQILGELDKSEQYYREALNISQESNEVQSILSSYYYLGWFHFDNGEYTKAGEFWEKEYEIAEKAGQKEEKMFAASLLLWPRMELGELEKAAGSIDDLYKFYQEVKDNTMLAWLDAAKGRLFHAQQRWEESIKHFEKSLQEWELVNARQWNIYYFVKIFLREYARMYLERDQQGDREKALNLLNQALEIFRKLGAKKDIESVEAKITYVETGKVVSKSKPAEPVSTGYADLDKSLNGGIPNNYVVVLTSPSCDERDLLIRSFLETGTKNDEVTFYMTINPGVEKTLAEEFPSTFHLLVCNPQADAIVASSPNATKLAGVENLTNISIALTSAIRKLDPARKGPRRICIDLVSDVLLQHHAVQTRRWLTALITELKSTGFTTLAVIDPLMHPSEELYAILGLFDGEINLFEKGPRKFLKIRKMSNQKYLEDELPLKKGQI
jgi:tetratricopeptide (TPR) repeat protein/KaiC/GvpD/RAD55 family RecA-like ATPase